MIFGAMLCKLCENFSCNSEKSLVKHVILCHAHEKAFPCVFSFCPIQLKTIGSFNSHIFRHRNKTQNRKKICTGPLKCPNCATTSTFSSIEDLLLHIRRAHLVRNENVMCIYKNCVFKTRNITTWSSHLCKKHKEEPSINVLYNLWCTELENLADINDSVDALPNDDIAESDNDSEESFEIENNTSDLTRHLALFLLKLQAIFGIPESSVQEIVREINQLSNLNSTILKSKLVQQLESLGMQKNVLDEMVQSCVDSDLFKRNTFPGEALSSVYLRNKFYRREFQFVEPLEKKIKDVHNKEYTFVYIPLLSDLQSLFEHPEFVESFMQAFEERKHVSGEYCSLFDGEYFRSNSVLNSNEPTVALNLYIDDWQAADPLGVAAKKYKITAVYYTVANLSRRKRSALSSIRLLLLAKSSVAKNCGLSSVLTPLINDIISLENGGLYVESLHKYLKGTVVSVSADNLGAHSLGGFFECFGRNVYLVLL